MKSGIYQISLLLACLLPLSLWGQETIGQHDFYKEDGVVFGNTTDQPFSGVVEYKFSKGEIQSQRIYASGLLNGITNSWYVNGHASKSTTYLDGKMHGAFAAWHRNGTASYQGQYVNGKQDGLWRRWDDAGNLVSEKTYDASKKRKFVLAPPKPPS